MQLPLVVSLGRMLLKRSQLEIRAESWIAKRLSPYSHISLPASSEARSTDTVSSSFFRRFTSKKSATKDVFEGGSGPSFDLQFDARPALALLQQMGLVRGNDEDGLEAITSITTRPSIWKRNRPSAFLSPECLEDDLGFPRILINQ